jgi:hypothetical protein
MTARQITEDIRWIMEDNLLDRAYNFRVKTSRKGDLFETTILGVQADLAKAALSLYLANRPAAATRVRDDYCDLVVVQPAT